MCKDVGLEILRDLRVHKQCSHFGEASVCFEMMGGRQVEQGKEMDREK